MQPDYSHQFVGTLLAALHVSTGMTSAQNNKKRRNTMEMASGTTTYTDAQRLVDEFRQLLGQLGEMLALGAPDSLLPASIAEIRTAILTLARNQKDQMTVCVETDQLRTAYVATASFLSYEEANNAVKLQQAFAKGDRTYIGSPSAQQTMARARRIEADAGMLAAEFDKTTTAQETSGLLDEIDRLLADLSIDRISPSRT